jgi:uncharacterized protein DUF2154
MLRRILIIVCVLALASLACGMGFRPLALPTAGPTQTEEIRIPAPNAGGTTVLQIQFGAGTLNITPGSSALLTGSASYNEPRFRPTVEKNGSIVTLKQAGPQGGPNFRMQNVINKWDLQLGSVPMNLTIEGGAYKASYDLGGLALTSLAVKDGAAQADLVFSAPNTIEMSAFSYETGASNVTVKQIGNASPATFTFRCGAGNYTLDFSGDLQRDLTGHVDAGLGNVKIAIPEGVPAEVTVEGGLSNITAGENWQHDGNTYSQDGEGPTVVLIITIGAGNLELGN